MENQPTISLAVKLDLGQLRIDGNIVPQEFYDNIKTPAGKTDLPAIIILTEIIYLYMPVNDGSTDAPSRAKFTGDMLQCHHGYFVNKFGLSNRQVRYALDNLEKNGLIRRELRTINIRSSKKANNVQFIEPIVKKIAKIINKTNDDVLDNFIVDYCNALLGSLKRAFDDNQTQKRATLLKEFSEDDLDGLIKVGFLERCENPDHLRFIEEVKK